MAFVVAITTIHSQCNAMFVTKRLDETVNSEKAPMLTPVPNAVQISATKQIDSNITPETVQNLSQTSPCISNLTKSTVIEQDVNVEEIRVREARATSEGVWNLTQTGDLIDGGFYYYIGDTWCATTDSEKSFSTSYMVEVEEGASYTTSQPNLDTFVNWYSEDKRLKTYTSSKDFKEQKKAIAPKGARYARFIFSKAVPEKVVWKLPKQTKIATQDTSVTHKRLEENYPEFSKYIPYIEKIEKSMIDKDCKFSKDVLNSTDTSLNVITQKLSYVCNKILKEKNIKPYPVQILATLKLIENVLTPENGVKGSVGNVKTGEGKSLVITLTAIILQSYGRGIDIVTSNMELVTRDWKESSQYYNLFGISNGFLYDKDKDKEFIEDAEGKAKERRRLGLNDEYNIEVMDKSIVYSTSSNFQWLYLKSVFSGESIRKREYDVCIVDEADNLLIDEASSPALVANDFPIPEAREILCCVYQTVESGKTEKEIKEILQNYAGFKDSIFTDEEIKLMINAAKKAQETEKGKDYVIEEDFWGKKVKIIDNNTGFKLESTRWHAYLHEMIELKEHIPPQRTSITVSSVSPVIYFGAYKNLLGVTGTIGSEKEAEYFKSIYKLSTFKVPTHQEIQRDTTIMVYDPKSENLYKMISKEANDKSENGRPVLIIMDSINAANELKEKYLKKANLIQGIEPKLDRESIKNAGQSGNITVSTIAAGRGTDIKLSLGSIEAGGLHVIVSKLPTQSRTFIQNIGRSSRQGQPGSATVYVRSGDGFKDYFPTDPRSVNLFRLQCRFSEYIRNQWPWMFGKEGFYVNESEYRFGVDYNGILQTNAEEIVDKFFWPQKVLNKKESQELLDLTKKMVLTVWGNMYTHLATSEKSSNMKYCEQEYKKLLENLKVWFPDDCESHEDCIRRWARKLKKDKEIFDFLYTHHEGMTVRDFLNELFKDERLRKHAENAGYDTRSFESMVKFMPEEHQKAYAKFVKAEEDYKCKIAKYNAYVAIYNKREAERAKIARENGESYSRSIAKFAKYHRAPIKHQEYEKSVMSRRKTKYTSVKTSVAVKTSVPIEYYDAPEVQIEPVTPGVYKGIINRGYDCSLNSALQMLYHNKNFRNLILNLKLKDVEKEKYLSRLKDQFEKINKGGSPENLLFSEELTAELTAKNKPDSPIYDSQGLDDIQWAQTRLLNHCIEESRNVNDTITASRIRKIFDYNFNGIDNPNIPTCFIKTIRDKSFEKTLSESVSKNIPESINIFRPDFASIKGFNPYECFEIIRNGKKAVFELCEVLVYFGEHFCTGIKDPETQNWVLINDDIVAGRFSENLFDYCKIVQYTFKKVSDSELLCSDKEIQQNATLELNEVDAKVSLKGYGGGMSSTNTLNYIGGSHAPDCPCHPSKLEEREKAWSHALLAAGDVGDDIIPGFHVSVAEEQFFKKYGKEPICNCSGHYGYETAEEVAPEATFERIRRATETVCQREKKTMPGKLTYPKCPDEPNWRELGWDEFNNLNVDKVIWDRWDSAMRSRYLALTYLQYISNGDCRCEPAKLGEMSDAELNRLDEQLRRISYGLSHNAERQERERQAQQIAGLAIRGTSGGIKILGGAALVAGSIGTLAAVMASGGTLLPLVVLTGAVAEAAFGVSDIIEGTGDVSAVLSGQGLDQKSYNPIRDELFGGNELVYGLTEMAVSLGTSAAASKALTNSTRVTTDGLRSAAKSELAREAAKAKAKLHMQPMNEAELAEVRGGAIDSKWKPGEDIKVSKWMHPNYVNNLTDSQIILGVQSSEKGLSTLGNATRENAISAGKAWVGENFNNICDNQGTIIGYSSEDKMKAFRLHYKPKDGMWRANFTQNYKYINEQGATTLKELKNVHIDILDK